MESNEKWNYRRHLCLLAWRCIWLHRFCSQPSSQGTDGSAEYPQMLSEHHSQLHLTLRHHDSDPFCHPSDHPPVQRHSRRAFLSAWVKTEFQVKRACHIRDSLNQLYIVPCYTQYWRCHDDPRCDHQLRYRVHTAYNILFEDGEELA